MCDTTDRTDDDETNDGNTAPYSGHSRAKRARSGIPEWPNEYGNTSKTKLMVKDRISNRHLSNFFLKGRKGDFQIFVYSRTRLTRSPKETTFLRVIANFE